MAKIKVAIYSRISTEKQEAENQLLQLRDYCKKSDYQIYKEYVDVISGREEKRPAFDKMFKAAHQKKFDLILFWDISRFSRSGTLFTLQKLQELTNLDIKWHSYSDPYFSSLGDFKDVVLSVMATVAKIERKKISERTKAGLERAKLYGRVPGRPKKDHAVYNHYCNVPGCRVRVMRQDRVCSKHSYKRHKKGYRKKARRPVWSIPESVLQ